MQSKWQWRVTKKEAGTRLLQFLRDHCPDAPSVKAIKRAIDVKHCTINRRIETFSSYILKENDLVVLDTDAFAEKKQISVPILYEDDELLIINKPVGLVSEIRALSACFPQFPKLALVHRLDKETSGALILAKSEQTKEKLIEQFSTRSVRKVYLAIVDGVVEKEEGLIDNYLGKKHSYQGQTIYGSVDAKKGQHAATYWKCLKQSPSHASVLLCEPYTGRTHQLRVHLSGMGHPILGDSQYGKRFRCAFTPKRNLLHAYRIAFKHPSTGKEVNVVAPIPVDFKEALKVLKLSINSGY